MPSVLYPIVAATAVAVALTLAASAQAGPDCTDIGPNTRMCTRPPGHTAIVTSPDPAFTNPYPGWGFGGLGFGGPGFGGLGFGIGGAIWVGL